MYTDRTITKVAFWANTKTEHFYTSRHTTKQHEFSPTGSTTTTSKQNTKTTPTAVQSHPKTIITKPKIPFSRPLRYSAFSRRRRTDRTRSRCRRHVRRTTSIVSVCSRRRERWRCKRARNRQQRTRMSAITSSWSKRRQRTRTISAISHRGGRAAITKTLTTITSKGLITQLVTLPTAAISVIRTARKRTRNQADGTVRPCLRTLQVNFSAWQVIREPSDAFTSNVKEFLNAKILHELHWELYLHPNFLNYN